MLETVADLEQFALVVDSKDNGVGTGAEISWRGFTGRMDELASSESRWKIAANDAVMREWILAGVVEAEARGPSVGSTAVVG